MKKKMSNAEYSQYVKNTQPKSPIVKDVLLAFLIGGIICCIGQAFMDLYSNLGFNKEDSGCATSITMVLISALLTGFGVYDNIAKYAGGGTLVPITGFANSVVSPALEFKAEGIITGTAVKMFTIAGPVIVFGIASSVVYGIIYYIAFMV